MRRSGEVLPTVQSSYLFAWFQPTYSSYGKSRLALVAPVIRYSEELAQYPLRGLNLRSHSPAAAAPQVAEF